MRHFFAVVSLFLLAACSTTGTDQFGFGGGGGGNRTLDAANDDVGSLVVAFDLPRGLGPVPTTQLFTFDAAQGGPSEHLRLTMVQANDADLGSQLPPLADGHAYYFFAIGDNDKARLAAAQASARARGLTGQSIQLGIVPKLCTSGQIDPNALQVTVLGGIPGQTRMTPFLDHMPLAQVNQLPGSTQMPACA